MIRVGRLASVFPRDFAQYILRRLSAPVPVRVRVGLMPGDCQLLELTQILSWNHNHVLL